MAGKLDPDFVNDAREENRKQSAGAQSHKNNGAVVTTPVTGNQSKDPAPDPDKKPGADKQTGTENQAGQTQNGEAGQSAGTQAAGPAVGAQQDEFKEKFDEYFKGSPITGTVVTEFVDDLKCNLLMIYAKKNGLDMTKDMFAMNAKSKELTAFLVDYGVQNKLFEWIKKYPLLAAGCVVGISACSSWLMVEMMKKGKDETEAAKKENQALKDELEALKRQRSAGRTDISDVEDLNAKAAASSESESLADFIKTNFPS